MNDAANLRRSARKPVKGVIQVEDAITEKPLGHIGNLSDGGMMLIYSEPLRHDSIYQLRFTLPLASGGSVPLEVGVHVLWSDQAAVPSQYWSGVRIIDISNEAEERLSNWLAANSSK